MRTVAEIRRGLGAEIRAERARQGKMAQWYLAQRAGLGRSTLSKIENGGDATLSDLQAIAGALGVPLTELLRRAGEERGRG